jgi:3-hydroxyisobutyrate dehydrogenase-like beta-hydroxyacid dehydrogenase
MEQARRCGIAYLDGAILGSPDWIGTPACTIFYSGPAEVFERAKPVLMAFGERTVFVGNEIGHASAFDVAVLTFGASAMLGFLQGLVVWESENLPAGGFLETIKGMMPTMESIFADAKIEVRTTPFPMRTLTSCSGRSRRAKVRLILHACSRFCLTCRRSLDQLLKHQFLKPGP